MVFSSSAPATTANLGPGFDCLGLTLPLRCSVTAQPTSDWSVSHTGPEPLPAGADDAVLRGARTVGGSPLGLTVNNEIPIGKGLGSSAAALVAGVAVAMEAAGGADLQEVFRMASELEGHPEQVGAAVYGGLILVTADRRPLKMPIHDSIRLVVAVPEEALPTSEARKAVRSEQPLDVVVRSLARMSALTAGLVTADPLLLGEAGGDEIHEAPRAAMSPIVGRLIEVALGAGAWHAARSGAGPSVLALCGEEELGDVRTALEGHGVRVFAGPVQEKGLELGSSAVD